MLRKLRAAVYGVDPGVVITVLVYTMMQLVGYQGRGSLGRGRLPAMASTGFDTFRGVSTFFDKIRLCIEDRLVMPELLTDADL